VPQVVDEVGVGLSSLHVCISSAGESGSRGHSWSLNNRDWIGGEQSKSRHESRHQGGSADYTKTYTNTKYNVI
jgi:hypothetical protein